VRYREKRRRASRGVAVFERQTLRADLRSGLHGRRGVVEGDSRLAGESPLLEEAAISRSAAAECGEFYPGVTVPTLPVSSRLLPSVDEETRQIRIGGREVCDQR